MPDEAPTHFQLILFEKTPSRHPFFLPELLLKKREKGGAGLREREAGQYTGAELGGSWRPCDSGGNAWGAGQDGAGSRSRRGSDG